ncbi:MAG: T9SS type A sorting domain-containing protein [Ignavibacteriaceae bacterium]|nr:T9SS type A sorting domain-containing protein [Ignavibacteriaceae bacterium]
MAVSAVPGGGWKCGDAYGFTVSIAYTDPGGTTFCHKTWKNDCKHWLWGSVTLLSKCTTVCNPYEIAPTSGEIASIDHHMQICEAISEIMTGIKNSGVTVDDDYCDAQVLYDDGEIFKECEEFRLLLAGYDIDLDDPNVQDDCFVPVITLNVIVPAVGVFDLNGECVLISPNPCTTTLEINLGSGNNYVSKIELVDNTNANIVYSKSGSIQSIETINFNSLAAGYYTVKIYNDEYVITKLVQKAS